VAADPSKKNTGVAKGKMAETSRPGKWKGNHKGFAQVGAASTVSGKNRCGKNPNPREKTFAAGCVEWLGVYGDKKKKNRIRKENEIKSL